MWAPSVQRRPQADPNAAQTAIGGAGHHPWLDTNNQPCLARARARAIKSIIAIVASCHCQPFVSPSSSGHRPSFIIVIACQRNQLQQNYYLRQSLHCICHHAIIAAYLFIIIRYRQQARWQLPTPPGSPKLGRRPGGRPIDASWIDLTKPPECNGKYSARHCKH